MPENRGRAEHGLQAVEGFVGVGTPGQGLWLPAEQGGKRGCEQTKTLDEATVEIGEAKESLRLAGVWLVCLFQTIGNTQPTLPYAITTHLNLMRLL